MVDALYIHIPFCDHICSYCDFPKVLCGTFSQRQYMDTLLWELESHNIPEDSLKTIYLGGGTPSALSLDCLESLLSYLHRHFPSVEEFTMECNPESLSKEKIELAKRYGVNRFSIGVQTARQDILKKLNRAHTNEDVIRCVQDLKRCGIDNYNLDFIYGLPSQNEADVLDDVCFALSLSPKHLSFYSLQIEEGTLLYSKHIPAVSDDTYATEYEMILSALKKNGFQRYEVSNFAIPSYESKHNLTYWHDREYYAAGLGASGYLGNLRYANTKSMNHYLQKNFRYQQEILSKGDEEFEFLMLNLRLAQGFSLDEFQRRFQKDFLSSYQDSLKKVQDRVCIEEGRFFIREDYLYTMDNILLELLKLPEEVA